MQGGEGKESGVCNAVRKVVCAMRNVVTELTENGTDLTHMVRSDVGYKPPPPNTHSSNPRNRSNNPIIRAAVSTNPSMPAPQNSSNPR
jgi:hypothetical protein